MLVGNPGRALVYGPATSQEYDITGAALVKATPGIVGSISVLVAGSGTGTVNDCATTGAAAATNEIFVIPETVGVYTLNWPCATGIVIVPGTGQTIAVSYA